MKHAVLALALLTVPVGAIRTYLSMISQVGWSGSVLIVRDDRTLLESSYGLANKERAIPATPLTVYEIESFSKQFTAAAVLTLVARGKIALDEPVSRVLDGVPADKAGLTIEDLLRHRSGLPRDIPAGDMTRDPAVARVLNAPLSGKPGATYAYCNSCYSLLAAIVEKTSGMSFRAFVRATFLRPLGLRETGFVGSDAPALPSARFARGYDEYGMESDPLAIPASDWEQMGSGYMTTTLHDISLWMRDLVAGRVLPPRETLLMLAPHEGAAFGITLEAAPDGSPVYGMGGDGSGFGTQVYWYPKHGLLTAVFTNVRHEHDSFPTRLRVDHVLPKIIFGVAYTPMPTFVEAPPGTWTALAGSYCLGGGSLSIDAGDGQPTVLAKGQAAVDLLDPVADEAEGAERARLDERTAAIFRALAADDQTALGAALQSTDDLPGTRKAFLDDIAQVGATLGQWTGTRVQGTSLDLVPHGSHSSVVLLQFEHGSRPYRLQWLNGQLFNLSTHALPGGYRLPLRMTTDGGLIAWDIVANRGIDLSAGEQSLAVTTGGTNVTATRNAAGCPVEAESSQVSSSPT